ncbi:hypothetical protein ACEE49_09120 [[Pasteurella] aerogenes]|uniref:Uncharacterized protein n=2 Tax=[Pasteurella] aerogenes-[Pasteurella] mairii-[Actinobacillus] rossii complex TaxID=310966 RepID=A0A380TWZ4_9PAST|nr:hypothetical protein [[Pasteurella] mairii]MDY4478515.1 hypothetical protein [[Pasteurella] aerogenes]SUB33295.1 Uncharacterised protein [[Pasteurella] mairii]SUT93160.1 Uncharacterised protein [[Actinobacillus] rossii]VEG70392.1 Uncharacterised protein [[Pasteurella] aerogenes]
MLELMDKSKTVKHFMWGLLITLFLFGIWWKLPEFILSIRWW